MTTYNPRHQATGHFAAALLFALVGIMYFIFNPKFSCTNPGMDITTPARMMNGVTTASYVDTPKQKPIVIPATKIPNDVLYFSLDTMVMVMQDFGIEMQGSRIREYQTIFNRQRARVYQYGQRDSIIIKK